MAGKMGQVSPVSAVVLLTVSTLHVADAQMLADSSLEATFVSFLGLWPWLLHCLVL